MPMSQANGVDIFYETAGRGPTMVFIHPLPFDHNVWLYQQARFSAHFRTFAMDLRGWGVSGKPTDAFTLEDMGDDIMALLAEEGITHDAVVVGCSIGSKIALMLACDHPDVFSAAVLIGGNSGPQNQFDHRISGYREHATRDDLRSYHFGHLRYGVTKHWADTPLGNYLISGFADREDIIALLLAAPASKAAFSLTRDKHLLLAVDRCSADSVIALIRAGASPKSFDEQKRTALWHAASRGDIQISQALLKAGADPLPSDIDGISPLLKAAERGYSDIARLLLGNGADPTDVAASGNTALILAASRGKTELMRDLLQKRVDPNERNAQGLSALMAAVQDKQYDAVSLLLDVGANPRLRNKKRESALDIAQAMGDATLVQKLQAVAK